MPGRSLFAGRINNGQSEVWFDGTPDQWVMLATNNIVYSVRTLCTPKESEAFHKAFAKGETAVPTVVADRLCEDFSLIPDAAVHNRSIWNEEVT